MAGEEETRTFLCNVSIFGHVERREMVVRKRRRGGGRVVFIYFHSR
jgi:hypothetical protein